jgi:beta-galactosidase
MTTQTMKPEQTRERLLMDPAWRFHLGDPVSSESTLDDPHLVQYMESKTGFVQGTAAPSYDDSGWRMVDLPHDWAVEGLFDPNNNMDHGFLPAGIGWYRKTFVVPPTDLGKRIYLEFGGVFRNSTVWLNGFRLGTHASGYTSFRYDVTDVLNYGQSNKLAVRVDASEFEGWWYEGAGIYRHVWLVKVNQLHIAPWGTCVRTEMDEQLSDCTVIVSTQLNNTSSTNASCLLESTIVTAVGHVVAVASSLIELPQNSTIELTQRLALSMPTLWSVDNPYLYRVITRLLLEQNGAHVPLDAVETNFGARTIRFDAETGFYLNGQRLKLKGTCNHQDHAGVGVALPDRLQEYRIQVLKEMGCNAYRCSHNPPTPELLDACDRLGMLVMDETRRLDSSPAGLEQLESLILRDRNHPCVIMWSIGNEEPIQATEAGARIATTMKQLVRRLDPTRPVTLAMNGGWHSPMADVLDVIGFNYFIGDYDGFHERYPNVPTVAAENGSTVCTRGIYANDTDKGYVSAYDANHPSWAFLALDSWKAVADRPWVAGTFVWTGFDYRGEPTPYRWPCLNSHFGILDTCGFPKDNYYYYQAWWSDKTVLHILPHWNWAGREGELIDIWVHSNCDAVELFLDGVSQGKQTMQVNGHLEWKVPYAPGAVSAKGYRGDKPVATAERRTTGEVVNIRLQPDRTIIKADGEDVVVVNVALVDSQGLIVPIANNMVRFHVHGSGRILGVGNGDPSCHEPDKANQRSAFNGLCQVILQTSRETGEFILTAECDAITKAQLVITTDACQPRAFVPSA